MTDMMKAGKQQLAGFVARSGELLSEILQEPPVSRNYLDIFIIVMIFDLCYTKERK